MPSPRKHTFILAHRANLDGPAPQAENSLGLVSRALALGFGLETDLRRGDGQRFYINHDAAPVTPTNALEAFTPIFARHPVALLAINVKELGYEAELVRLQASGFFGTAGFYFDFELLEPATPGQSQRKIRAFAHGARTRLAARISDRCESLEQCLSIPAQSVWADEFDGAWLTFEHIQALRSAGRRVIVVSPELHGRGKADRLRRWADFKKWSVDGICTDFSIDADKFFNR